MSGNENGDAPTGDQAVWLNQRLAQLREQRNKGRENIYQLEADLRQAHRTIHGLSKNIDKGQDNINQLNHLLKTCKAEIQEQAAKIEELEEIITRQKRTIKVQSDKISETRETFPRRTGQDARSTIYDRPPPVYNQPQPAFSQPSVTLNQPQPVHNPPPIFNQTRLAPNQLQLPYNHSHPARDQFQSTYNQHYLVTKQSVPVFNHDVPVQKQSQLPPGFLRSSSADPSRQKPHAIIPFRPQSRQLHTRPATVFSTPPRGPSTPSPYTPHESTLSSSAISGTMEVYRPPSTSTSWPASYNSSFASQERWVDEAAARPASTAMVEGTGALTLQHDDRVDEIPWPAEFGRFFKLTEDWARNYANVPNEYRDSHLPDNLFASMRRQACEHMVTKFLGSDTTRYFLIARLMNIWVCNDMFQGQCFLGYSSDFDQKFRQSIQVPQNDPIYTRASLLIAVADAAKEMQARPTFQQFLSSLVSEKVDGMWERLHSLLAPGILEPQAFDDMVHLIGEAIRMGLLMITTPLAYSIEFPRASHTTYFRPDAMINRDPELRDDPQQQLSHGGATVRLGITPVIVITSFAGPSINPRTVHFANVLLQREPKRLDQ